MPNTDSVQTPQCSPSSLQFHRESLPKVRSSCVRCSKSIVHIDSPLSDASGNDACRICQSETGAMVRPCSCDGSVSFIF